MSEGKRIRLLLIIPTLDRCGAEKQLTLLAGGLSREVFDVHVAVLTRTGPLEEELRNRGIPITFIRKRGKFDPFALGRLKKLIRTFSPDIVHTWLFAANAYGRYAAMKCGVPNIICGERCLDPWKKSWHFIIDRYLARFTKRVAVNSEGIRDFYVQHGIPDDKFVVIPNAVIPLRKSPITKKELLTRLKIDFSEKDPPFLIGMVARFWPQKRLKEAIWSCDQLKFSNVNFHLIIIGDGPERDSLFRYREELLIQDRVHFAGQQEDVSLFMSHFDLLWCTSAYEGQSNSILEAMSVGVPVFASDIPGNRELVVPGETGLLIPEFDGDINRRRTAFKQKTLSFFLPESRDRRLSYGKNAIQRIEKDFSLEKMLERYSTLYQSLVLETGSLKEPSLF